LASRALIVCDVNSGTEELQVDSGDDCKAKSETKKQRRKNIVV